MEIFLITIRIWRDTEAPAWSGAPARNFAPSLWPNSWVHQKHHRNAIQTDVGIYAMVLRCYECKGWSNGTEKERELWLKTKVISCRFPHHTPSHMKLDISIRTSLVYRRCHRGARTHGFWIRKTSAEPTDLNAESSLRKSGTYILYYCFSPRQGLGRWWGGKALLVPCLSRLPWKFK